MTYALSLSIGKPTKYVFELRTKCLLISLTVVSSWRPSLPLSWRKVVTEDIVCLNAEENFLYIFIYKSK